MQDQERSTTLRTSSLRHSWAEEEGDPRKTFITLFLAATEERLQILTNESLKRAIFKVNKISESATRYCDPSDQNSTHQSAGTSPIADGGANGRGSMTQS